MLVNRPLLNVGVVILEKQHQTFECWLDKFFDFYFLTFPVNASFIGKHEYDGRMPDFSKNGLDKTASQVTELLQESQSFNMESLSEVEGMDLLTARGFLETQLWELTSGHVYFRNPSYYMSEAVFGIIALFLTDYSPFEQRAEAALQRLEALPAFLDTARQNLQNAPKAWVQRAVVECRGLELILNDGFQRLFLSGSYGYTKYKKTLPLVLKELETFVNFLNTELVIDETNTCGCGEETFKMLLEKAHFLDESVNEILDYALAEMEKANVYLKEHAADFGAATPQEALAGLANLFPPAEAYYGAYRKTWEECRRFSEEKELVTWPDFPIEYVPRPEWVRSAAPSLYFLFYRSPAAYKRPPVHQYLVSPLPEENQEDFLRANNDSVIKLNHVVHHGSIGHHVQNWNAFHSASRIGQMAAVDTASRIAMLSGGTMAEGWACYTTELMSEMGFLTPLESYSEYQSRRRMCARAVVDVKLHRGDFNFAEAVAYYQENAGMGAAAVSEVVKNSMYPGGAVMYLCGTDLIFKLRQEIKELDGKNFSLGSFHDEFLSYGSLPVALIRKSMIGKRK